MVYARWIKNKENRLVRVWDNENKVSPTRSSGITPIVENRADAAKTKFRSKHLVLAWVNPELRSKPLSTPIAVINANQEIGLLVGRCNKYAKLLKLSNGPLHLWTVPIKSFDSDWRISQQPAQTDIQPFFAHVEKYGADKKAMEELVTAREFLESSYNLQHAECGRIAQTGLGKVR